MNTKIFSVTILVAFLNLLPAQEQKTVVKSEWAFKKLLSSKAIALQWISWNKLGTVLIGDDDGTVIVSGEQRSRSGDYLTIEGIISSIEKNRFYFEGDIVTRISHINKGQECLRSGHMEFAIKGGRSYWRLQNMNSPCSSVTDYVDIFFTKDKYPLSINALPKDSTIRVLNIGPKFEQGMPLIEGKYHVEVSRQGFKTQKRWLELGEGSKNFSFQLKH